MASPLILPLNRPQYVPSGEVLVSELARRALTWNSTLPENGEALPPTHSDGTMRTVVTDPNAPRRFQLRGRPDPKITTIAPATPDNVARFAIALREAGLQTDAPDQALTRAFIEAATGVTSEQGRGSPASPMSRNLSLSQNLRGVLGTHNPPDMGGVLEAMFQLGRPLPSNHAGPSMGELWIHAADLRLNNDAVLKALDTALGAYAGLNRYTLQPRSSQGSGSGRTQSPDTSSNEAFTTSYPRSPFGWLHENWIKLMSDDWVVAIPPRVWADWTTMVLRVSLAFGFLWECRWFEAIGRAVLTPDTDSADLQVSFSEPLLPWPARRLPVASRNVKPAIKLTSARAVGTRAAILAHDKGQSSGSACSTSDIPSAIAHLRSCTRTDGDLAGATPRESIRTAMAGRIWNRSANNIYETIVYSLQQRSTRLFSEDYYGFMQARGGRYSVVAPGTEWIAVIASLAADAPGGETHLGNVVRSLGLLGLQPELLELVELLESAGLARGSADADHGVRVRSAF